jgi:hypothetical protein
MFALDYAHTAFKRQRHWHFMATRADVLFLYMMINPKQEWLSRIYTRIAQCCYDRPSQVMIDKGGIYYLVSPHCWHTYIGETGKYKDRWDTHMSSVRTGCTQRVHRWISTFRNGSSYTMMPITVVMPLEDNPRDNAKNRRVIENWLIQ